MAPQRTTGEQSRDVASMKEEIADVQSKTTASLDRAIAVAQSASKTGGHIAEELHEQRQQMGGVDADVNHTAATLKHTGHQLKHGFTWRGALTSPFRKGSRAPLPQGAAPNLSPVFTTGAAAGATRNSNKAATRTNRNSVGGGPSKGRRASGEGLGKQSPPQASAGHVPEGFDDQLDVLDGLVDGLRTQADAIGEELKQQNEGIEVLAGNVETTRAETAAQSSKMRRRFGIK